MGLIPIRVDRTSKPPLGTPLRTDGHWSAQGLVGAWAFNEGAGSTAFDYYQNNILLSNPRWIATGIQCSSGDNNYSAKNVTPYRTILFRCIADNNIQVQITQGNGCNRLLIYNGLRTFLISDASYNNYSISYANFPIGIPVTVGFTYNYTSGDINAYNDGKLVNNSLAAPGIQLGYGCDIRLSNSSNTFFEYIQIYDKTLTTDQIKSLSENPWQIYEPETVWISTGSSGGMVDSSSAWAIRAGRDVSTSWMISAIIGQPTSWSLFTKNESSSSWGIFAYSEENSSWNVLTKSTADLAWAIQAASSSSSSWAIVAAISKDTAWQILTSGTLPISSAWAIRALTDNTSAWRVLTSADASSAWTVFTGLDRTTAWNLMRAIGNDASWKVCASIQNSTAWGIISEIISGEIERVVMSSKTGRIVILTKTGSIIIT